MKPLPLIFDFSKNNIKKNMNNKVQYSMLCPSNSASLTSPQPQVVDPYQSQSVGPHKFIIVSIINWYSGT